MPIRSDRIREALALIIMMTRQVVFFMAGVLDNVNQRTQLVGQNRLELLLFKLKGRQFYGINVFKVKEVLPCPRLNSLPKSQQVVRGVAHVRGETVSVIDMGLSIGLRPIPDEEQVGS